MKVYSLWFIVYGKRLLKIISLLAISYQLLASYCFAEERFFELKAKKFSYNPNIIRVNKDDLVKLRLISEDVHHGFFLDGYAVKMEAFPGQEGSAQFVADKNGRFSFRCSVTCGEFHPYMIGYLVVGPNNRFLFFTILTIVICLTSLAIKTHG